MRRTGDGYMTPTGHAVQRRPPNALCRAVARIRLREDIARRDDARRTSSAALTEYDEKLRS